MAVTASIGSSQGGDFPYVWRIEYDDVTQRVTAEGSGSGNVKVVVQITAAGGTKQVMFLQPGRAADAGTDFSVTMGAGPTVIGPTINPNQVARIVGKIGTPVGGLPFEESSSRT